MGDAGNAKRGDFALHQLPLDALATQIAAFSRYESAHGRNNEGGCVATFDGKFNAKLRYNQFGVKDTSLRT